MLAFHVPLRVLVGCQKQLCEDRGLTPFGWWDFEVESLALPTIGEALNCHSCKGALPQTNRGRVARHRNHGNELLGRRR